MTPTEKTNEPQVLADLDDSDLNNLAVDIFKGRVFTDRHCKNAYDIPRVFLPLGLMEPDEWKKLQALQPYLIYEYLTEASSRSVNDMPIFISS